MSVVRRPVRITAVKSRWDAKLVGHEATAYTGSPLLNNLLRLSDEASSNYHCAYIRANQATVEPLTTADVKEKVLL